jgi:hypothetical protein
MGCSAARRRNRAPAAETQVAVRSRQALAACPPPLSQCQVSLNGERILMQDEPERAVGRGGASIIDS